MAKQKIELNSEVSAFLDALEHPLRPVIEELRIGILSADNNLTESIKWNGPNYSLGGEDRITMRVQPPTSASIQLIFHRGAKKQERPKSKLIDDPSNLLIWKENDRAVATFKSVADLEEEQPHLTAIVKKWLSAAK
ncbi:DUF1801 domain-containing protein [Chryseobacterium koreense]|uniref:YdhG-like domain-containing protein n=1 Tax=Chryseobacterium koreense CCUG 49689 TaxID=1304281 RepID=A0A0J7IYY6_9FLAO|nr:DUF1801 domain-containing protein [Chryseobacterium koreense]KMQ71014.1 hypothetical protein ACM44_08665 [Chryseobacterium koreense CCUG 49689]MBB5334707.1 hypothetical protein [Chryseobacterium koreense]